MNNLGIPESGTVAPSALVLGSVHRILLNGTFNLTAQGLNAFFNLIVVFILARGLGKEVFGEYFTLFALILAVQLVLEMGISTVLTRRIAQMPENWKEIAGEGAVLFLVIVLTSVAVFLGLGVAWAWYWGDSAVYPAFVVAGLTCAAIQVERFCAGMFRAFELFGYENLGRVMQGVVFASLVLALYFTRLANLLTVLVMLAASHVTVAIFLLATIKKQFGRLPWGSHVPLGKKWFAEAVPLGIGDVVRGLTWQLDTVLLSLLQSPVVVGIYSVAYRPLGPLNWLPRAALAAAFPAFSRMAEGDHIALNRAISASIRLLWIISLPIAVTIFICAEPLIVILAGREYLDAVLPMRILIWITTVSFISMQFRFICAAVGKQQILAGLVIFVFVLEVGVELMLIPMFGYFGACAGSMVGEFLFAIVGLAILSKLGIGVIEWKELLRATLAAAAMGTGLWFVRGAPLALLVGAVVLSTGLYVVLCILLGALRWYEVRQFYEAITGSFRFGSETADSSPVNLIPNACSANLATTTNSRMGCKPLAGLLPVKPR